VSFSLSQKRAKAREKAKKYFSLKKGIRAKGVRCYLIPTSYRKVKNLI